MLAWGAELGEEQYRGELPGKSCFARLVGLHGFGVMEPGFSLGGTSWLLHLHSVFSKHTLCASIPQRGDASSSKGEAVQWQLLDHSDLRHTCDLHSRRPGR